MCSNLEKKSINNKFPFQGNVNIKLEALQQMTDSKVSY